MGKLVLYNYDLSPAVRSVKIVGKILGLEFELRDVDLLKREQLKESYLKLNPEHTVPTLIDDDFVLCDSNCINAYLIDKYGNDDALYPKDLQLRAKCNHRLLFNAATLSPRLIACGSHVFFKGGTEISKDKIDAINAAYEILEVFLKYDPYLTGERFTVADVSSALTVSFLEAYLPLQPEKHPRILAWLVKVNKNVPFFEEFNVKYKIGYHQLVVSTLQKNKQRE